MTRLTRRALIASAVLHVALIALVWILPGRTPEAPDDERRVDVVFYRPPIERPRPKPLPLPEPVEPSPRSEPEVRRPAPPPQPVVARAEPKPRPEPRPKPRPQPKPQTGAFADERPRPATRPEPVVAAAVGGFAPATERPRPRKAVSRVVAAGSFSDGSKGLPREAVSPKQVSVGQGRFDAAPAVDAGPAEPARGKVERGGFGDTVAVEARREGRPRPRPKASPDTPVSIVSKPKPVYTDEARRLKIEGEVLLEVTFVADGRLRVLRVIEGLGHGLDEAAVQAAKKIKFKPARRNGTPVDHTATLRVVFRLA